MHKALVPCDSLLPTPKKAPIKTKTQNHHYHHHHNTHYSVIQRSLEAPFRTVVTEGSRVSLLSIWSIELSSLKKFLHQYVSPPSWLSHIIKGSKVAQVRWSRFLFVSFVSIKDVGNSLCSHRDLDWVILEGLATNANTTALSKNHQQSSLSSFSAPHLFLYANIYCLGGIVKSKDRKFPF